MTKRKLTETIEPIEASGSNLDEIARRLSYVAEQLMLARNLIVDIVGEDDEGRVRVLSRAAETIINQCGYSVDRTSQQLGHMPSVGHDSDWLPVVSTITEIYPVAQ